MEMTMDTFLRVTVSVLCVWIVLNFYPSSANYLRRYFCKCLINFIIFLFNNENKSVRIHFAWIYTKLLRLIMTLWLSYWQYASALSTLSLKQVLMAFWAFSFYLFTPFQTSVRIIFDHFKCFTIMKNLTFY